MLGRKSRQYEIKITREKYQIELPLTVVSISFSLSCCVVVSSLEYLGSVAPP